MFGEPKASCAAPILFAQPSQAVPGEEVLLRGVGFSRGGCETSAKPNRNVRIVFWQDSRSWELAAVDVDRDSSYKFKVRVRVPSDARPGKVIVRATGGPKKAERPLRVLDEDPEAATVHKWD